MCRFLGCSISLLAFAGCSDDDTTSNENDNRPAQSQGASHVSSLSAGTVDLVPRTPCEVANDLVGVAYEGSVEEMLSGELANGTIATWSRLSTDDGDIWIAYSGGVVGDEEQSSSCGVSIALGDQLLVVDHGRGVDAKYGALAPDLAGTIRLNADGSLSLAYGKIAAADADAWLALRAASTPFEGECTLEWLP